MLQANSLRQGPQGTLPGREAVERRAVRRLAGRQQRLLLLRRRHVGAAAADRRRARSSSSPARWAWTRSARCAGTAPWRRPAWTTSCRPTTRTAERHGVLAPYDGLSRGIISSLQGVGYGIGRSAMPIVTGQDAEVPSVKAIIAGEQYSTVFKDTRELAKVTADMVDTVLSGKEPEDQRHQDLQQRRQGRAVLPADAACRRQVRTTRSCWSARATSRPKT